MATKHKPIPRTRGQITASTPVKSLAWNTRLDGLTGSSLIVYLRCVAATSLQRSRRIHVVNPDLFHEPRTVLNALAALVDAKLIRVSYDRSRPSPFGRTIEVL